MTKAPALPPRTRPSGTDDLSYGQLAAARKTARHLLDSAALTPAEHGTLTPVVQRITAAIDARPVDLDGAHQVLAGVAVQPRRRGTGRPLHRRPVHAARRLPEALEADVGPEQTWASVRAFAAHSHWRTADD